MIERSIVFVLDWILGSCRATIAFLFILLMKKKEISFYNFHIITVHEMTLLTCMREANCKFVNRSYIKATITETNE